MSAIDPEAKRRWLDKHLAASPPVTPQLREELARLYASQARPAQGRAGSRAA